MVSPKGDRQLAFLCVCAYGFRDCFGDTRDEARVPNLTAERRVLVSGNRLKLMVPIKDDIPIQLGELRNEAGLNKADGRMVDAWLLLDDR